jgi:hypothetical protein
VIYKALSGGRHNLAEFRVYTRFDDPGKWDQVDGRIRIDQMFTFKVPLLPRHPPLHVDAVVTLESTRVIDDLRDPLSPRPDWRVQSITFTAVVPIERKGS